MKSYQKAQFAIYCRCDVVASRRAEMVLGLVSESEQMLKAVDIKVGQ